MRERPDLRATGRVVVILEPTPRRDRIVGVLQRESNAMLSFVPADLRLPKFKTRLNDIPADIRNSIEVRDLFSMLLQKSCVEALELALSVA